MKKFILISMVFICLIAIFMFSNESGEVSMETTIKVSNVINYENDNFFILRKCGHFIEFCILEICIISLISCFRVVDFKCFIISLIFCLLYAFSDEIHQLFVIGRSARIMDVCIDFCGSIVGGLFFLVVYYVSNECLSKK